MFNEDGDLVWGDEQISLLINTLNAMTRALEDLDKRLISVEIRTGKIR
jgi:hypothetical protein